MAVSMACGCFDGLLSLRQQLSINVLNLDWESFSDRKIRIIGYDSDKF